VVEDHLVDHDATASPLEGKDDELPLLERRNRSYGLVFASVLCARKYAPQQYRQNTTNPKSRVDYLAG
jgi:hypothetical protein